MCMCVVYMCEYLVTCNFYLKAKHHLHPETERSSICAWNQGHDFLCWESWGVLAGDELYLGLLLWFLQRHCRYSSSRLCIEDSLGLCSFPSPHTPGPPWPMLPVCSVLAGSHAPSQWWLAVTCVLTFACYLSEAPCRLHSFPFLRARVTGPQ